MVTTELESTMLLDLIADMKARVTETNEFPIPAHWLVMNAPRPLLGDQVFQDGPFLSGRFYAAIDPEGDMAASYVEQNRKLDARVVVFAPKDIQVEMALIDHKYAANYRQAFSGSELYEKVSPERRLLDMPAADLIARKQLALAA